MKRSLGIRSQAERLDGMEWSGLDGVEWNGRNGSVEWLKRISVWLEIPSIKDSTVLE